MMLSALKADIRFQVSQGFYLMYFGVVVLYAYILSILPSAWVPTAMALFVFSDPAGLGLFFIGGILLLERDLGMREFWRITPLPQVSYMASKIVSLSALSLLAAFGIAFSANLRGVVFQPLLFMAALTLSATFYTALGYGLVQKAKSMNHYFIRMIIPMVFLMLPVLSLLPFDFIWDALGALQGPLRAVLMLFPSTAGLSLILASASVPVSFPDMTLALRITLPLVASNTFMILLQFTSLIIANIATFIWAIKEGGHQ